MIVHDLLQKLEGEAGGVEADEAVELQQGEVDGFPDEMEFGGEESHDNLMVIFLVDSS